METITISPKFQITLPKEARDQLGIQPGDRMQILVYDGRIELIPIMPIEKARGFLEGIGSNIEREQNHIERQQDLCYKKRIN